MRPVRLELPRRSFIQALADLRQWIDHYGAHPVLFGTEGAPGGRIRISLEFITDNMAAMFRRDWKWALADADRPADPGFVEPKAANQHS